MKCKKTVLSVIVIMMCLLLVSCDPPNFYHDSYTNEVISIDLIEYDGGNIQNGQEIRNFDFEKSKIIEALNKNDLQVFLSDLTELFIITYRTHPDSPNEVCIRICFDDGTFEIISKNRLIVKYNENGDVMEYIGMVDDYNKIISLINKYFNTQI